MFATKLRELRASQNLTQEQLANLLGVSKSSISMYENGKRQPNNLETLEMFADFFNVDIDTLVSSSEMAIIRNNRFQSPILTTDTVTFPVIGEIAAGYESIAVEDWTGETVEIPSSFLKGREYEDYLVLSVKGDSMYPHFMDGDKVLILRQTFANNNGDVCAVVYDDEMATLKKVVKANEYVELVPINPEYKPRRIDGEEIEHVHIIGIPKLLIREIEE